MQASSNYVLVLSATINFYAQHTATVRKLIEYDRKEKRSSSEIGMIKHRAHTLLVT